MADRTVVVRLVARVGQYTVPLRQATVATTQLGMAAQTASGRAAGAATTIARASSLAGKALLLGVGAGLAISAKAAVDFESSFTGIRKTVDATEPQFARLALGIRDMAKEIPIAVDELNRIGELGGQLGVPVQNLESFTETVAKMGVTTLLGTEEAALGLSRLAKVTGTPLKNAENLGSAIVDLGNNFATTEPEILNFALRIAPVAKTVGLTADEVLGLATAFSAVGVPAERGGTSVQRTFLELSKAVAEGTEKLDIFAATAKLTPEAFTDLFRSDPAEAFLLFLEGLDRLGPQAFNVLNEIDLGNQRSIQSLLALAGAGDLARQAITLSTDAFASGTALQEEAAKRFATTASKIEIAKNQLHDFQIEIGQGVLPVLGDLVADITTVAEGFQNLPDPIKSALGFLLGMGAAAVAVNKLSSAVQKLGIASAFTGAAGAAGGLLGRIGALTGFIAKRALPVLGVYLGAKAIGSWINRAQTLRERHEDLISTLDTETGAITDLTLAWVKNDLAVTGSLKKLRQIGISPDSFANAVLGGEDRDLVVGRLTRIRDDARAIMDDILDPTTVRTLTPQEEQALYDNLGISTQLLTYLGELRDDVGDAAAEVGAAAVTRINDAMAALRARFPDLGPDLIRILAQSGIEADQVFGGLTNSYDDLDIAIGDAKESQDAFLNSLATAPIDDVTLAISALTDAGTLSYEAATELTDAYSEFTATIPGLAREAYTAIHDSFVAINEEVRSGAPLWGEYEGAAEISVSKITESLGKYVEDLQKWQERSSELISGVYGEVSDETLARLDSLSAEQKAALASLSPRDFQTLIDAYEGAFGEGGTLDEISSYLFLDRLPMIAEDAVAGMAAAIVDKGTELMPAAGFFLGTAVRLGFSAGLGDLSGLLGGAFPGVVVPSSAIVPVRPTVSSPNFPRFADSTTTSDFGALLSSLNIPTASIPQALQNTPASQLPAGAVTLDQLAALLNLPTGGSSTVNVDITVNNPTTNDLPSDISQSTRIARGIAGTLLPTAR